MSKSYEKRPKSLENNLSEAFFKNFQGLRRYNLHEASKEKNKMIVMEYSKD